MNKSLKLFFVSFLSMFLMSSCSEPTTKKTDADSIDKKKVIVDDLMTRRSIRNYKDDVVPRDIMNVILECGIYAPNGMDKQPWEISVVDNPEILNGMTEAYLAGFDENDPNHPKNDPNFKNMFYNAPTVAFIAMEPGTTSQIDCGLLAGNMVNAAWAYGIGSCIQMSPLGFFKTEAAKPYLEKLSFSEGYEFLMAISFGYPNETPIASSRIKEKVRFIE